MPARVETYRADVVIPCYQEQDALPLTAPDILSYFRKLQVSPKNSMSSFRLLLIDDGSKDKTWDIIEKISRNNHEVIGIKLSRNYGHQMAMLSGLSHSSADIIITMDADLQDDIQAVEQMLAAYESGSHLALGVREDRTSDSPAKRWTANTFYRVLSLLGVNIIENHADFRLMSRRSLDALLDHSEVNLFLRGLIPAIGFPVTLIPYTRKVRVAGETKYTIKKMLHLALDGVTSFSVAPLRVIAALGGIIFTLSILSGLYVIVERVFFPQNTIPGWASTVFPLLLLSGMQIFSVGVVGEYVGKIYMEVKKRPRFIVEEITPPNIDGNTRH
ncbi:glycosyltransferase family 2 protein [Asaia siamensis]|uniref:Glycosyl transferase n=1 Tax=Asaia siamensis TaxID=110479 RepID=A0ABQ1LSW8_9PROT|nr:glycosyltransferase family 2 protein [Asaia siamensis]GBR04236.1 glycosyltransferase [Asaia siamensis NRIC 0323]GGC28454.1 glycosyl transferase [Asaia siamensis]